MSGPERALQQRLASIDRMRDFALESGNVQLLEQADQLEAMARQQHGLWLARQQNRPQPPTTAPLPGSQPSDLTLPAGGTLPPDPSIAPTDPSLADNPPRRLPAPSNDPRAAGRRFGQAIAERARQSRGAFGRYTSQQAREMGREFGQANAAKVRPLPPLQPEPTGSEPATQPTTNPPTSELPVDAQPVDTQPAPSGESLPQSP